jgi:hypothetical protein
MKRQHRRVPQVGDWHIDTDVTALRLQPNAAVPDELIPAASLTFSGLRNTYRRDGFGAELVRQRPTQAHGLRRVEEPSVPYRETPFPALTALLLFDGTDLDEVLKPRARCASWPTTRTAHRPCGWPSRTFRWPPTSPRATACGSRAPTSRCRRCAACSAAPTG